MVDESLRPIIGFFPYCYEHFLDLEEVALKVVQESACLQVLGRGAAERWRIDRSALQNKSMRCPHLCSLHGNAFILDNISDAVALGSDRTKAE